MASSASSAITTVPKSRQASRVTSAVGQIPQQPFYLVQDEFPEPAGGRDEDGG